MVIVAVLSTHFLSLLSPFRSLSHPRCTCLYIRVCEERCWCSATRGYVYAYYVYICIYVAVDVSRPRARICAGLKIVVARESGYMHRRGLDSACAREPDSAARMAKRISGATLKMRMLCRANLSICDTCARAKVTWVHEIPNLWCVVALFWQARRESIAHRWWRKECIAIERANVVVNI